MNMFRETDINKFLNGRQFFILTAVLFVVAAWIASFSGRVPLQGSTSGICYTSAAVLSITPVVSLLLNAAGMVGVCALLAFLNRSFSFVRNMTYVFSSSYLLLAIANPYIITHLYDGTMLSLVVMVGAWIMFSTYLSPYPQRRVYLSFTILSACCMFQYAFVYLLPVFFIGFMQMRAVSLRSVLAMVFGLATPFWIVLGTGMVSLDSLMAPKLLNVWDGLDLSQSRFMIVSLAVTVLFTAVLIGVNVLQIIRYKMQVRAYNGFFLVLSFFTMLMMAIDYNNALVYQPVLNICLAVQMAHTFTIKNYLRRYIPYLLFALICMAVFVWRVMY